MARIQEKYGAEVFRAVLATPETLQRMNAWASEKTKGKIRRIADCVPALAGLIALNAIYFKGTWEKPFQEEFTRERVFHVSNEEETRVPS